MTKEEKNQDQDEALDEQDRKASFWDSLPIPPLSEETEKRLDEALKNRAFLHLRLRDIPKELLEEDDQEDT